MLPFQILFEDTHLLVLSKPAGLLSQGEKSGDENLVDLLRAYFGRNYVGLIHRLDRNTSGLMVIGKRSKSAQRLTDSLQNGKLSRAYLAWVLGKLPGPVRWEHRLEKNPVTNRVSVSASSQAKKAVLRASPMGTSQLDGHPLTLVRFDLETGRSHQIRAQSSHEGFPLLGDVKYQTSKCSPRFSRVALHSFELIFPHPMTQEILKFEDPLPSDLAHLLKSG